MGDKTKSLLKGKGGREAVFKFKEEQTRKKEKHVPVSGSGRNW